MITADVTFYIWIRNGVKCFRTFPCGHYHQRPRDYTADFRVCWCVAL